MLRENMIIGLKVRRRELSHGQTSTIKKVTDENNYAFETNRKALKINRVNETGDFCNADGVTCRTQYIEPFYLTEGLIK